MELRKRVKTQQVHTREGCTTSCVVYKSRECHCGDPIDREKLCERQTYRHDLRH